MTAAIAAGLGPSRDLAARRPQLIGRGPAAPPLRRADGVYVVGAGDLADEAAAEAALALALPVEARQGCDTPVNVAGGFRAERVARGSTATWESLYASNLKSALNLSSAAIPRLPAGGRIINIGAAAAKSAVARLTESPAEELRDGHISVNAVLPNVIDTPRIRAEVPNADPTDWISPEAIADVILFLTSPAARAISGALIPVTRPA